jgi:hypothetical protein
VKVPKSNSPIKNELPGRSLFIRQNVLESLQKPVASDGKQRLRIQRYGGQNWVSLFFDSLADSYNLGQKYSGRVQFWCPRLGNPHDSSGQRDFNVT